MSAPPTVPRTASADAGLSRVPYLPGLDGLRAIAVIGVMIYHAHHDWMPGGFLGVEVFFVISGYLITLLLMGERERNGHVDLRHFWVRRFRRLLPALYVMMALVAVYIAAFYPMAREQTRGDFMGGIFYVSNWYEVFVGQGYGASEAFVPLRHLWSLAVEEQFYLVWPLVMVAILRRSRSRLPAVGLKLIGVSVVIAIVVAWLYVPGVVATSCGSEFTRGTWTVFGRCIAVNDMLYLGSFSRAGGLMLGAGFAMLWRPVAIMRGPLRDKGRRLDVLAALALAALVYFMLSMYLQERGVYNPWLYRGGFFLTGLATLLLIAAITHHGTAAGKLLGSKALVWVGTRSYGLYLYHWPVFQMIRKQANIQLSIPQIVLGMLITVPITEASYRFIETPIRKNGLRATLAGLRGEARNLLAGVAVVLLVGLAAFSLQGADPHCVGEVNCSLEAAAQGPDTTLPAVTTPTEPATTVPGETTTTSTTIPKEPQKYVAIGESVMVGAQPLLESSGIFVQAKEGRGPEGVKNAVIQLDDSGDIGAGSTIVIQVGTNAPLTQSELDAIMAAVPAEAAGVVFMTIHADIAYVPANNDLLRAMPDKYANVSVLDWDARASEVDLCTDGIHISCNGSGPAKFYTNLILEAFGLPAIT
ncbi:MAG TPA: acyltransferase family protein [Ilumatobacteraceae bacterium]|nr:acyltransferase family protein [Ilumatobacteraceae bacterium]